MSIHLNNWKTFAASFNCWEPKRREQAPDVDRRPMDRSRFGRMVRIRQSIHRRAVGARVRALPELKEISQGLNFAEGDRVQRKLEVIDQRLSGLVEAGHVQPGDVHTAHGRLERP